MTYVYECTRCKRRVQVYRLVENTTDLLMCQHEDRWIDSGNGKKLNFNQVVMRRVPVEPDMNDPIGNGACTEAPG